MSTIDRFLKAQEDDYETALSEIKRGKKSSCWMWYIFPQIKGLGKSEMSQKYEIKDIEEAKEYLENDTLKSRLIEITQALLNLDDVDIKDVMGFDSMKLKSSMTLFKKVEETYSIDCENIFQKTLEKYFNGEEDNNTILILEKQKFEKEMKKDNDIKKNNDIDNNKDIDNLNKLENNNEDNNVNNNIINNDALEKENKEGNKIEIIENDINGEKNIKNKEDEINLKNDNNPEEFSDKEENSFEINQMAEEIKIEKVDSDMKIEEINEESFEKEENYDIKNNKGNLIKNNSLDIVEENNENDMMIIEEDKNLLEEEKNDNNTNNNNSKNNLENISDENILTKRKTIHFSLPSRSQMKSLENKKSEVEMFIDSKNNFENKDTLVIYPYDGTDEKKCCPDCCIF